jgi:presenilin-like A22 family membrane protease
MKHPFKPTLVLTFWLILSTIATLLVLPFAAQAARKSMEATQISANSLIALIVVAIGIGALFWTFAINNLDIKKLKLFFALALASATLSAVEVYISIGTKFVGRIIIGIPILLIFFAIYLWLANKLSNPLLRNPNKYYSLNRRLFVLSQLAVINNSIYITVLITFGAVYGFMLTPLTAFVLFVAVAIYDAWAVWKSKIMVKMATFFIDKLGIFPGIMIAYENPQYKKYSKEDVRKNDIRIGILGGGDLLFLALITAAFTQVSIVLGVLVLTGMTVALLGLFLFGGNKPYPAIPFMLLGFVLANLVWVAYIFL